LTERSYPLCVTHVLVRLTVLLLRRLDVPVVQTMVIGQSCAYESFLASSSSARPRTRNARSIMQSRDERYFQSGKRQPSRQRSTSRASRLRGMPIVPSIKRAVNGLKRFGNIFGLNHAPPLTVRTQTLADVGCLL